MSELSVGALSGLAANSYVIDVASGSTLDVTNATGTLPSAQLPAGTVLQVLDATSSTNTSTTSTSPVDTSLSATITPSSSSSKIFVTVMGVGTNSGSTSFGSRFRIYRGGVSGTALDSLTSIFTQDNTSRVDLPIFMSCLDSPSTTSAVTYTVGIFASGAGATAEFGKIGSQRMTLMEVAG